MAGQRPAREGVPARIRPANPLELTAPPRYWNKGRGLDLFAKGDLWTKELRRPKIRRRRSRPKRLIWVFRAAAATAPLPGVCSIACWKIIGYLLKASPRPAPVRLMP